jgi:hypothetical protein
VSAPRFGHASAPRGARAGATPTCTLGALALFAGVLAVLACACSVARADLADHMPGIEPFVAQATQLDLDSLRGEDHRQQPDGDHGQQLHGFVGGNSYRSSSLEYPAGSGYENTRFRAGIWGVSRASAGPGAFTGVTTAAVDGAQGTASQSATEFTPAGLEIGIRSTLPNNKFFNHAAISEEDLIGSFSDRPAKHAAASTVQDHRPINILVRHENYMWSFSDYQHFVIFHYTIKNLGPPLANAYVGFYSELASGNKNAYSGWPPSSTAGPGAWFSKKWMEYDTADRMIREHFCFQAPAPGGCALQSVPYWVGVKLLGCKPGNINDVTDKQVTLAAWTYAPGSPLRDEDTERYGLMSAGTIQDLTAADLQTQTGDPVSLLSVGPFPQIDPGDSIQVDFAIVGGAGLADPSEIQRHAAFAQRAYDRDYIVPVPPPSPLFRVVAHDQALDYYWDDSPESAVDVTSPYPIDFEGFRLYIGRTASCCTLLHSTTRRRRPTTRPGSTPGSRPCGLRLQR